MSRGELRTVSGATVYITVNVLSDSGITAAPLT